MDKFHIEHTKFSKLLERMEKLQYNLDRIHSKIGLEGFSEFEDISNSLQAFYESTMDDLIFEANADDPTNNCNTKWMNEVIDACRISMGDD